MAVERLRDRGAEAGIEVCELVPALADFNVDLLQLGAAVLLRNVLPQLVPDDRLRYVSRELDEDMNAAT